MPPRSPPARASRPPRQSAKTRPWFESPAYGTAQPDIPTALGGRADEARALSCNPDYSLERRRTVLPYRNPKDFDHIVEGLRKADLP